MPELETIRHDALARRTAGDLDGAAQVCREALGTGCDSVELQAILGVLEFERGRSETAVRHLAEAASRDPRLVIAVRNLVPVLLDLGQPRAARVIADRAVALEPDNPTTLLNLAAAALACDEPEVAIATIRAAQRHAAAEPRASALLARAHLKLGDEPTALRLARGLAAAGASDEALAAGGWLLHQLGRLDEAEAALAALLGRDPSNLEALVNRGAVCRDQGRTGEAIDWWRRAVLAHPGSLEARYNLACGLLLAGRWSEGWPGYEHRWQVRRLPRPEPLGLPLWDGAPLPHGTLLVHHEQGLGDTLQFVRLLPRLLDRVGRIVLLAQPALCTLLAGSPIFAADAASGAARIELRPDDRPPEHATAWIPLLSLPLRLDLRPDRAAEGVPYLRAPAERVETWRSKLSQREDDPDRPLRVGLVWRGNLASPAERGRSLRAELLAPLLQLPGLRWSVLQKDLCDGELPPVGPGSTLERPGHGFDQGPDAFLDSAGILASLDLVITSDTSMAHLAGAMGRPVWLLLRTGPDWRWGGRGERSAWYPSMRLFRQDRPGDWAGVVGRVARSLAALTRSRAAPAATPGPFPDLAAALRAHAAGRVDEAARSYRLWLRHRPEDPRVLGHLAMAILAGAEPAGDTPGELIARAVALMPADADLHANHGVVLRRAGQPEAAEIAWREALRLVPGHRAASINLVRLLVALGRHDEARAIALSGLAARPEDRPAQIALAQVLADTGDLEAAAEALERCCAADAGDPAARAARAALRVKAGDLVGARDDLHAVLLARPDSADALCDLGVVERSLGRTHLAVWLYAQALRLNGEHVAGWLNLGVALDELGRHAEAAQALGRALELEPGHAEAAMALGMTLLREGRFREGATLYERRLDSPRLEVWTPPADLPMWPGGDPRGLRLLLVAEQGFGDAIQFVRYAAVLKRLGAAAVVVGCRARIARLLAGAEGVDAVVTEGERLPPVHAVVPLMSLPHRLGTTLATVPAEVPYLSLEPELVLAWAERLRGRAAPRIGLVWQGNPDPRVDRGRSIPLGALAELLALPGLRFIALQKGPGAEQVDALPPPLRPEWPDPPLDEGADGFLDTAAVIVNLDLVVTTDTAVAHLAGALGRPVWLLLGPRAEWRWLRDRADSPWYPTMRLFRAPTTGHDGAADWAGLAGQLRRELLALRDGDRSRLLPVTGETGPVPAPPPADLLATARALLTAGDHAAAAACAHRLLAERPGHLDAALAAAAAALHEGEHALAEIVLRLTRRNAPDSPELACNLALALKARGAMAEAERLLASAAACRPLVLAAAINHANLLREMQRPAEALTALAAAVEAAPDNPKVLRTRGNLLRDLGRHDEAISDLAAACAAVPEDPETALDHALALLAAGRLREGFAAYEVRWRSRALRRPETGRPIWDGRPSPGATLLVHAEQGLGDTIQFVRFLAPAARRWGGPVILACQETLLELLRSLDAGGADLTIVSRDRPLPPHDTIVPLMSLPDRLGLAGEAEIPSTPYLAADPARVARWRPLLPSARPRIGLVWQGNPKARADRGRSPGLAALAPLLRLQGPSFVSLQREHGLADFDAVPEAAVVTRLDPELDAGDDAFVDTAAVLAQLDVVVGCDTAVMHLAGAMGRPCLLLLKAAPDWRWQTGRRDTPWYPRTRLVRQARHGDWASAVEEVMAEFSAAGPGVPRSFGVAA